MAPPGKEGGGSKRRKSINLFSRAALAGLTQINTDVPNSDSPQTAPPLENGDKKERKKLGKRASLFGLGPSASPDLQSDGTMSSVRSIERSDSPKIRPRTLQKGRPVSIFGSLGRRSNYTTDGDEGESDNLASGTPESPIDDGHLQPGSFGSNKAVVYHGEIQTTSGMFRKKKEYLVLTETHLIRFKSQSRASETFHSIPPSHGRSSSTRHPSTTSIGSLQEVQSTSSTNASSEGEVRIPLEQIVTVYKVEDGRPFFTTEVVYLDEGFNGVGSIQLMLQDPNEADLWHTSIRGAAQKARLVMEKPFPDRVVNYLVSALEEKNDYDTNHFQVFRVARRQIVPKGGKSSSDDLQKLGTLVFYMVIGLNRLHMIPVPDYGTSQLVKPKLNQSTFGIAGLFSIWVNADDDRFELAFRIPCQGPKILDLAANATQDIAVGLIRAWQYIKPHWDDFTFKYTGPKRILQTCEQRLVYEEEEEEFGSFERTLVAYCMAYGCNPANIQYAVDFECEDAPGFILYPPTHTKYTNIELLSVLRALRYNESFRSISFRDIDLHSLHGWFDPHGTDHVAWWTREGTHLSKHFNIKPEIRSILYQEVQAIALRSAKLSRMDFTNTLPRRRPKDNFDYEGDGVDKDPGCEIVAALMPLCRAQLSNVTWIILSGIELGETDLDDLIPAIHSTNARVRAIEFSRCGLSDRGIMQMITSLERQNSTLEYINISDNPGRIDLEQFQKSVARFSRIKRLDISRTSWTSGPHALFLPEVMLSWRLEELILSGVPINESTLDSIAAYLTSDMSDNLRVLQMDQCNLNGHHVALLMHAMTRTPGEARQLSFHVSANRLEKGVGEIVEAIQANHAPSHLFLRMIEFTKEDYFRQLLHALRTNNTIRVLDISKASLPYDAGEETCDELRLLFEENETLEDLDISGEQAHLEVTRFGIGLNYALTGLKNNTTLKILRIEYQNLGLEGANTLSDVLEENTGLTHIYCEHNEITLQGFTILVNALARNYTVLELPWFQSDQKDSIKKMNITMRDSRRITNKPAKPQNDMKSSMRRTLTQLGVSKAPKPDMTPQDLEAVVNLLHERWEHEIHRMEVFLERNKKIAAGIPEEGSVNDETLRPTTALSDRGILEHVLSNTTPRVELGNPVEMHVFDKMGSLNLTLEPVKEDTSQVEKEKEKEREVDGGAVLTRGELGGDGGFELPELRDLGKEKVFELEGENGMFTMED